METETQQLHLSIMKELSDIKTGLAVNTSETTNIKTRVSEIQADGKESLQAIKIQNGRVRTLEDWSNESKKVLENTTKIATDTYIAYGKDKTGFWTAIKILWLVIGTILSLGSAVAWYKVHDVVRDEFSSEANKRIIKEILVEALKENVSEITNE